MNEPTIFGVDYAENNTLLIEYYRSELTNTRCVLVSEQGWQRLFEILDSVGIAMVGQEVDGPFGPCADYEQMHAIIGSVYSVQGMKRHEGESCLPAIERLVCEYAKLK